MAEPKKKKADAPKKKRAPRKTKPKPPTGMRKIDPHAIYEEYLPIVELIFTRTPRTEIARRTKVPYDTIRSWERRPGFQKALRQFYDEQNNDIQIRMAHRLTQKVERIKELGRLYEQIPDEAIEKIVIIRQGVNEKGEPVGADEVPVRYVKRDVPIRRSNAPIKAALLRDIGTLVDPTLVIDHRHHLSAEEAPAMDETAAKELMDRVKALRAEEVQFEEVS